jgi:hypothetical protein
MSETNAAEIVSLKKDPKDTKGYAEDIGGYRRMKILFTAYRRLRQA